MERFDEFISFIELITPSIVDFELFIARLKNEHPLIYASFIAIIEKIQEYSKNELKEIELYTHNFKHEHIFRCNYCSRFINIRTDNLVKKFLTDLEHKLHIDEMIEEFKEQRLIVNVANIMTNFNDDVIISDKKEESGRSLIPRKRKKTLFDKFFWKPKRFKKK